MAEPAEADAAFEAPRPTRVTSDSPTLRLGAYEGPLDLLLELARAQRVDLTRVSVLTLAEQFVTAVEAAIDGRRVPLAALGGWLVAAASLMLLRSRLLLPAGTPANREAEREAALLRRRLADRAAVQRLAAWLERRPQLGRDVFGRGASEPEPLGPPVADLTELLRGCLRLLALPVHERVYRPNPPLLWRVPEALMRMRQLLTDLPQGGAPLGRFLPPVGPGTMAALQRRAALASTLVAALELGREGALTLEQREAFGAIAVRPRSETPAAAAPTAVAASPHRSPPAEPGTAVAALSSAARPAMGRTEPIWDAS